MPFSPSYRRVAVHAAHAVEIDGGQTLVRQAVVKAAPRTVAPLLVCVVQRHLETTQHTLVCCNTPAAQECVCMPVQ